MANRFEDEILWLRERAETNEGRGDTDAARDCREMADLAEQRGR